jgi:CBS domain-containing protein
MVQEHNIRAIPIVDGNGVYVGMFSMHQFLHQILPIAVTMERGLDNIDFVTRSSRNIVEKMKDVIKKKVSEVMDRNVVSLHPGIPTLEAIRVVVRHGSPIPVLEKGTNKLLGLITEQSLVQKHAKLMDKLKSIES